MKKTAVLKHFKSSYRVAKVLGINLSAVSRWGELVPELRARQLHELTGGKLAFNPKHYQAQ